MKLKLTVIVPLSAEPHIAHAALVEAAAQRQGLTLLTPALYAVDVDLVQVEELIEKEGVERHVEY